MLFLVKPSNHPYMSPTLPLYRPFYYPLMPSYWFPSRFHSNALKTIDDSHGPQDSPGSLDDDVAEEESKVRSLLNHRTGVLCGGLLSLRFQLQTLSPQSLSSPLPP